MLKCYLVRNTRELGENLTRRMAFGYIAALLLTCLINLHNSVSCVDSPKSVIPCDCNNDENCDLAGVFSYGVTESPEVMPKVRLQCYNAKLKNKVFQCKKGQRAFAESVVALESNVDFTQGFNIGTCKPRLMGESLPRRVEPQSVLFCRDNDGKEYVYFIIVHQTNKKRAVYFPHGKLIEETSHGNRREVGAAPEDWNKRWVFARFPFANRLGDMLKSHPNLIDTFGTAEEGSDLLKKVVIIPDYGESPITLKMYLLDSTPQSGNLIVLDPLTNVRNMFRKSKMQYFDMISSKCFLNYESKSYMVLKKEPVHTKTQQPIKKLVYMRGLAQPYDGKPKDQFLSQVYLKGMFDEGQVYYLIKMEDKTPLVNATGSLAGQLVTKGEFRKKEAKLSYVLDNCYANVRTQYDCVRYLGSNALYMYSLHEKEDDEPGICNDSTKVGICDDSTKVGICDDFTLPKVIVEEVCIQEYTPHEFDFVAGSRDIKIDSLVELEIKPIILTPASFRPLLMTAEIPYSLFVYEKQYLCAINAHDDKTINQLKVSSHNFQPYAGTKMVKCLPNLENLSEFTGFSIIYGEIKTSKCRVSWVGPKITLVCTNESKALSFFELPFINECKQHLENASTNINKFSEETLSKHMEYARFNISVLADPTLKDVLHDRNTMRDELSGFSALLQVMDEGQNRQAVASSCDTRVAALREAGERYKAHFDNPDDIFAEFYDEKKKFMHLRNAGSVAAKFGVHLLRPTLKDYYGVAESLLNEHVEFLQNERRKQLGKLWLAGFQYSVERIFRVEEENILGRELDLYAIELSYVESFNQKILEVSVPLSLGVEPDIYRNLVELGVGVQNVLLVEGGEVEMGNLSNLVDNDNISLELIGTTSLWVKQFDSWYNKKYRSTDYTLVPKKERGSEPDFVNIWWPWLRETMKGASPPVSVLPDEFPLMPDSLEKRDLYHKCNGIYMAQKEGSYFKTEQWVQILLECMKLFKLLLKNEIKADNVSAFLMAKIKIVLTEGQMSSLNWKSEDRLEFKFDDSTHCSFVAKESNTCTGACVIIDKGKRRDMNSALVRREGRRLSKFGSVTQFGEENYPRRLGYIVSVDPLMQYFKEITYRVVVELKLTKSRHLEEMKAEINIVPYYELEDSQHQLIQILNRSYQSDETEHLSTQIRTQLNGLAKGINGNQAAQFQGSGKDLIGTRGPSSCPNQSLFPVITVIAIIFLSHLF